MTDSIIERLKIATTSPNKWNSWPDQLELIDVRRFNLRDAHQAYEAGKLFGAAQTMRQITPNNFPAELNPVPQYLTSVFFSYAYDKGQEDSIGTRNMFAMFEYREPSSPGYQPTELIVAEIGCKHEYDMTGSRMCLSVGKCKKCGHKFLCDSGD